MEKPKRGAQHSPKGLIIFLLAVIVILSVALGSVVFTVQVEPEPPKRVLSDGIIPYDVVMPSCAPLQRTYNDPVVVYNNDGTTSQVAQTTATALAYTFNQTPAPPNSNGSTTTTGGGGNSLPNTGGGGGAPGNNFAIAATSVVTMNNGNSAQIVPTVPPPNQQSAMPTMGSPATYTPMPTMTMSPIGTPMPNSPNVYGTPAPQQPSTELNARLSAGEIDDNELWNVYMTYRSNFAESPANSLPVDDVDVRDRQLIRVVNNNDEPILGATVEILSGNKVLHTSCTYATGYTMYLPYANDASPDVESYHVRVSKQGFTTEAEMQLSEGEWTLTLDIAQGQANLDILFLIDATGSMDDEIAQLTNNILYISEQIHNLPDDINVRYGLVSYKDWTFPTQVWDFTADVNLFQSQLAQLFTAGGDGETLNDGFDRALHAVQWRGDDTAKLIFLVGDEPPGVYEDHPSYAKSMLLAGQAGIKVHPIASSGLDVQGEYIFRQIAQTTMGHFIFLTYGGGQTAVTGGGDVVGSTGNEDFGEYSVDQLHEIVLNLIRDELSYYHDVPTD